MSKQKNIFKNFLIAKTSLWMFAITNGRDSLDIVPGKTLFFTKISAVFFMAYLLNYSQKMKKVQE